MIAVVKQVIVLVCNGSNLAVHPSVNTNITILEKDLCYSREGPLLTIMDIPCYWLMQLLYIIK